LAGPRAGVVPGAYYRIPQRLIAAGDEPPHQVRRDAECRWCLTRIEDAEAAARPGADIPQTAAVRERRDDRVHRVRDLRDRRAHRRGHLRVLVVHELEDLVRRERRERGGARVAGLGPSLAQRATLHASSMAIRAAPIAGSSRT